MPKACLKNFTSSCSRLQQVHCPRLQHVIVQDYNMSIVQDYNMSIVQDYNLSLSKTTCPLSKTTTCHCSRLQHVIFEDYKTSLSKTTCSKPYVQDYMFKTIYSRLHVQDYVSKTTYSRLHIQGYMFKSQDSNMSQHIVLPELSVLQGEYCGHVKGLYDLFETLPSTSINIDTNPNLNKWQKSNIIVKFSRGKVVRVCGNKLKYLVLKLQGFFP